MSILTILILLARFYLWYVGWVLMTQWMNALAEAVAIGVGAVVVGLAGTALLALLVVALLVALLWSALRSAS